ncbi:MAG: hypothetical protein CMI31_06345 [Opitutae bacterium]|nr:hypothetical protein [Opitutae bacterium]
MSSRENLIEGDDRHRIAKPEMFSFFGKCFHLVFDSGIVFTLMLRSLLGGQKLYLICGEYGRIGNRLFFFSHVIAWAKENNAIVYYPSFFSYASWFKGTRNDYLVRYPRKSRWFLGANSYFNRIASNCLHRISLRLGQRPDSRLVRSIILEENGYDICSEKFAHALSRRGILFLRGFVFTSKKDFLIERQRSELQQHFRPPSSYEKGIQEPFEKLKGKCDVVVGVVIRHGDYREYRSGEYFYSLSVFQRVLEELTEQMSPVRPGFFIASDENQDTSAFESFPHYFRQGHPVENINALARCDLLTGSPSTFLTWPAFFGNIPCVQLFPDDLKKNRLCFPFKGHSKPTPCSSGN